MCQAHGAKIESLLFTHLLEKSNISNTEQNGTKGIFNMLEKQLENLAVLFWMNKRIFYIVCNRLNIIC